MIGKNHYALVQSGMSVSGRGLDKNRRLLCLVYICNNV